MSPSGRAAGNGRSGNPSIEISVDGVFVPCRPGEMLLDAIARAGASGRVPALCRVPGSAPEGSCRLCLVEVEGQRAPVAACHTPVAAGQVVHTSTAGIRELRRGLLELWARARPAAAEAPAEAEAGEVPSFVRLLDEYGVPVPLSRSNDVQAATHAGLEAAPPAAMAEAVAALPGFTTAGAHPYLRFDADRCIACRRCLTVCEDRQGQFVYGMEGRGSGTRLIFGRDQDFTSSPCVSCGACVEACPTAALTDLDRPGGSASMSRAPVRSVCGYCGVGCNVDITVAAGRVDHITGTAEAAVNAGHLCAKGRYAHAWQHSPERLTTPLLRQGGELRPVSWATAIDWLRDRLLAIRASHGPDALGVLTSSRSTNEAAYLFQKLFRTVIGTNNVDCCARVCHSSTALGLQLATGTGAASASYADIEGAKVIVVAGANPTEAHPVVGARIKQAARRGARLIVIDPREIELAAWAELHLRPTPGTNVALFNGLARVLVEEGLVDQAYVDGRTEGYADLRRALDAQPLAAGAATCGVPVEDIRAAARIIGHGGALFVTGLGLSELTQGVASVLGLTNLALLTGSIGRPGAGMLPLRGQNNVQGNADMGASPGQATGYQSVHEPASRARFAAAWGVELPVGPGLTIPEMFAAARAGRLRGLWIQGEDVAQSDPNESEVRAALGALDLLVVQEIFLSETARHAHLVLPAAGVLEQDGTFTNGERRIQRVRAALAPPGEARPDWIIARDVANALGAGWDYPDPARVMDEIARVAPALFGGVAYARLEGNGLQWPCPDADHPGTAMVHADGFASGRARLLAVDYEPTPETCTPDYPLLLITGRVLQHYNVGTMTRRTPSRGLQAEDYLDVHPADAKAAGLRDGGRARIESRYGRTEVTTRITGRVSPGTLFLSFHFPTTHANVLTSSHGDARSRCPEYKVTAVRIAPASVTPAGTGS